MTEVCDQPWPGMSTDYHTDVLAMCSYLHTQDSVRYPTGVLIHSLMTELYLAFTVNK